MFTKWQRKILVYGLLFLAYMATIIILLLLAIGANVTGAALLYTEQTFVNASFALVTAPIPVISALIYGIANDSWIILILNLPAVVIIATMPIATKIMNRIRIL